MPGMPKARETVLITGSNGFLGQALARRLIRDYDVVGLDMAQPRAPVEGVRTIEFDLTSDTSVGDAIAEARRTSEGPIASVIHLAAYYDTSGKDNPKYREVNVEGTRRLLAALGAGETGQFVFSSTLLVHAPGEPERRINEDSPLDPGWPYPRSKVETEAVIRQERGGIPAVILRLAGIYDEDCKAAFIAQQIARIFERLPTGYVFAGNIDRGQPYLHLDDFVDAVARTVDRRQRLPAETTLLIGEERTPTYRQLQREIGRLVHGERWLTLSLPKSLAVAGTWIEEEILDEDAYIKPWMAAMSDDHYELDISRARELLGWQPHHDLVATLPAMVARLKQDPTEWYARNKLEPATVAASGPEIEQARQRLDRLPADRLRAAEKALDGERRQARWCHLVNMALGLWLLSSPFAYGLFDAVSGPVPPALGHDIPAADVRDLWLGLSEMASGIAVIVFSALAMTGRGFWAAWAATAVGLWVVHAPLVFWTTNAAAYAVDSLVGMLVITLAVIVAPAPGIAIAARASAGDRPLGWSYSPSSFSQRAPIVALAFVGLFISRYLAAYQLGHIESVWEPFFGAGPVAAENGTAAVITSAVSKSFPISDAGFGAVAYMLDIVTGAAGDRRRWRTMPWLVLAFGMLIIPVGMVSVIFIIIQPTIIGTLCTLCLVQTVITVILIPYSVDEVLATAQFLMRSRRAGRSFWRTLVFGGPALAEERDADAGIDRPPLVLLREFLVGGVNYPWTLAASAAVGGWLMATPLFLDTPAPLYFSHHIVGTLVITLAVTAMAEVARPVRFLNVLLGAWVVISAFVLGDADGLNAAAAVITGVVLIGLSLPRGKRSAEHYGGWDRLIV